MFRAITDQIKNHYRDNAISYGKFEEAIDIFIRLIDNDNDTIEALQFLLQICGIDILRETMTDIKSPNISQQLFFKKSELIIKKIKSECNQWESVMEKFQLYSAYFKRDFNRVHECIQFFRCRRELVNEFHAIIIWICFSQSDIQAKYWHERLQYLLRLCELAIPFINSHQNTKEKKNIKVEKNFEDIFFISEVTNDPQKRQIPFGSLLHFMHDKNKKSAEKIINKHICSMKDVHLKISQFLSSYLFELIQDADQRGRYVPDISFQICDSFTSCKNLSCQKHHVMPSSLILYKRLKLAFLQYAVMQKLDALCNHKLKDQSKTVFNIQKWWIEKLVEIHICYQSSQISCPEVTYAVLAQLPKHIRDGIINIIHRILLSNKSKDGNDFVVILKCMFVFQQLQDKVNINKFYSEMSEIKMVSHPINLPNLPIDSVISVEKRLSLFFYFLHSNQATYAITHIEKLIQYVINNIRPSNTFNTLGNLVSLMEFKISLVFATGSRCDFCLPRAYLVNYFEAFTTKPLISKEYTYDSNENYLVVINNSFDQVQQLLDLICKQGYFTIILRLIRLLVLIGLNESTFASKVLNFFKQLNNRVSSIVTNVKIKKYLMKGRYIKENNIEKDVEEREMEYLVKILHDDLSETNCDSLIIVHNYRREGLSKFFNLEKYGIMKLSYNSIEDFHCSLQKIILSVTTKNNEQVAVTKESQELVTLIQSWFHFQRMESATKEIQTWFRKIRNKKKLHPILNEVYNEMIVFCRAITKEKGKETVYRYNILLRGRTVDVVVKLINLQSIMDVMKNELQELTDKQEGTGNIAELEDNLKFVNINLNLVNQALESLSVIKNFVKHKEVDIEWLEGELKNATDVIDRVQRSIEKFDGIACI
jgi:hypothetical protein